MQAGRADEALALALEAGGEAEAVAARWALASAHVGDARAKVLLERADQASALRYAALAEAQGALDVAEPLWRDLFIQGDSTEALSALARTARLEGAFDAALDSRTLQPAERPPRAGGWSSR
jgi:hypothetical protein